MAPRFTFVFRANKLRGDNPPKPMNKTCAPEKKFTCGIAPLTTNSRKISAAKKIDLDEVAELAHAAWLREGSRPGLERQYVEEVLVQLRATRHLLVVEQMAGV